MKYLFFLTSLSVAQSYITQPGAMPPKKQLPWLQKLTGDICDSEKLSEEMIQAAPRIMHGWATAKHKSAENAVAVERLVKRLVDERVAGNEKAAPTVDDYNCMLEGWARSGEGVFAAERCEQILTQMQARYEEGDENVQPNLGSFKVGIMAWRQCQTDYSAARAQQILEWMVHLYTDGKNEKALPDSDCFDIVLQSWARTRLSDAPRRAEKLLGFMEKLHRETGSPMLQPRTISFNAVLTAWGKSNDDNAWKRSLDILSFMSKLYLLEGNARVAPDDVTHRIVLGTLARDNRASQAAITKAIEADKIMKRIQRQYKAGELQWKPDTVMFNFASGLWAKSGESGAFRKTRSLLDRQLHLFQEGSEDCRPDVVSFTSVISSCASESGDAEEKRKAFQVALSTFQQLTPRSSEFGEPNHVTYGTMLKACAKLLPNGCPERSRWTQQTFEECRANGMVGDMVLSKLREAATKDDFKALMRDHTKRSIPSEWSCNVDEKNSHRRKDGSKNRRRAAV